MHQEVIDFINRTTEILKYENANVVEVGAQNVNGRAMDAANGKNKKWTGIDLVDGPDVDYVGNAALILPELAARGEIFDIAISTEVLEHTQDWREIVIGLVGVLRQGGHLVLTCAGPGRDPHNANGLPYMVENEYYKNVSIEDLEAVLGESMIAILAESGNGDTRYFGVKK